MHRSDGRAGACMKATTQHGESPGAGCGRPPFWRISRRGLRRISSAHIAWGRERPLTEPVDRVMAYMEKLWRRMLDVIGNVQREFANKSYALATGSRPPHNGDAACPARPSGGLNARRDLPSRLSGFICERNQWLASALVRPVSSA